MRYTPPLDAADGNAPYIDGNPSTGVEGSIVPAAAIEPTQREILAVIEAAGLTPDGEDWTQLLQAIAHLIEAGQSQVNYCHIDALPTEDIGPVLVIEAQEWWTWQETDYFTGYRSLLCGAPIKGHTLAPLPHEIDAAGGAYNKLVYPGLWGYAQENSLVVASGNWTAGTHFFADLGGNNFRVPDKRNMFDRYAGTDADTANATPLGAYKADTLQSHDHVLNTRYALGSITGSSGVQYSRGQASGTLDGTKSAATGAAETAPKHTAYLPRLHV
jgi:hypothetical protein